MRVGILTVSDRGFRGERGDESGPAIREVLAPLSPQVERYEVVPDEQRTIEQKLVEWCGLGLDLILTTGGTGLAPRDVTPEATRKVVERLAPGFGEAMRQETRKKNPHALLSRAVAGTRGKCLIINLPGSPRGVRECLEVVLSALPHAIETVRGEARE